MKFRLGILLIKETMMMRLNPQVQYDVSLWLWTPQYYRNVIDVLRGDAEPETDGRAGLKSLELLTAAYISARDRTTVGLPLKY